MFNYINLFKKKFLSFKKTYKINIFYTKNKKTNFISSLSNFSKINKSKTWTNVNFQLFSYKINFKSLLYYFINFIIVALFVYFKYNSIIFYFKEVLPFEIRLNIPTYLFILNSIFEFFLNLWWIVIFFINTNLINLLIFIDSNIINLTNVNLGQYQFLFNNLKKQQKNNSINKKNYWQELSQKSYDLNYFIRDKYILKNMGVFETYNYKNLRTLNLNKLRYYNIYLKDFKLNLPLLNDFFNFKNTSVFNQYNNVFISQKNLIKNNKLLNKNVNSLLWIYNKTNFITKFNFINTMHLIKKNKFINEINYKVFNNKYLLSNTFSYNSLNNFFYKSKNTASFFKKL